MTPIRIKCSQDSRNARQS